jgi:hypothetical protein
MFEHWREKRAEQGYEKGLAVWEKEREAQVELLETAKDFEGADSDQIMLAKDESLYLQVGNVALIEDRVRGGHYEGRSSGVSVPIGSLGGRTVRYHVGANKGHYVQGTPTATAIDVGTVYVTNKRVVFQGPKQTRECNFAKLIGVQRSDESTTFAVSNRQKPTTIAYGDDVAGAFDFRLALALAHFKGTVDEIVNSLQHGLDEIDAKRPTAPVLDAP